MALSGNVDLSQLSAAERILLAQELWESVHEETQSAGLTPAQREELHRRLAQLQSGEVQGIPWAAVRSSFLPKQ